MRSRSPSAPSTSSAVTAGIAFLPDYASLGTWSIILLSIFRIGQGIAQGGSWDGLPSLLALKRAAATRQFVTLTGEFAAQREIVSLMQGSVDAGAAARPELVATLLARADASIVAQTVVLTNTGLAALHIESTAPDAAARVDASTWTDASTGAGDASAADGTDAAVAGCGCRAVDGPGMLALAVAAVVARRRARRGA